MASELVHKLVDSGIHFGHRVSRWNPKMRPFIYAKRNAIHIIDIRETVKGLLRAKKFIAQTVGGGGDILFVGTKRQAKDALVRCAQSVNMPYVSERWLGGTLTNFRTIRSRLTRLEELEKVENEDRSSEYSKKQWARMSREHRKIDRNLSGIRKMTRLPAALLVVDVHREHLAVREARSQGIPTVCLIDTDSNPDFADIPIPGNDDAMRSIDLVLTLMTEAISEGLRARKAAPPPEQKSDDSRRRSQQTPTDRSGDGDAVGAEGAKPAADAAPSAGSPDLAQSAAPEA